jgi:hypothetical protein
MELLGVAALTKGNHHGVRHRGPGRLPGPIATSTQNLEPEYFAMYFFELHLNTEAVVT